MIEKITMEIKKKELEQLLLNYYEKDNSNKNIKVIFESNEELIGYREGSCVVTKIKLKENISLGNQLVNIEKIIGEDDIKEMLNIMLSEHNYDVLSIIFEVNSDNDSLYGNTSFSFKSLKVNLNRKQKQKTI